MSEFDIERIAYKKAYAELSEEHKLMLDRKGADYINNLSRADIEYLGYVGRLPTKGHERKESTPYILILVASVIINIISSFFISQG